MTNPSFDATLPYAMLLEDLENVADTFLHQYRSPELVADLVLFFAARILDFEEQHYSDFEKAKVFEIVLHALEYRRTFHTWPDTRPEANDIASAYTANLGPA